MLKKSFFFLLFLFLFSFVFLFSATIDPNIFEVGQEFDGVLIQTTKDMTEHSTWRGEFFEVPVSMPGLETLTVTWKDKRHVSCKFKVSAYPTVPGTYTGTIYHNRDGMTQETFTYTIRSKPEVMNCVPSASYVGQTEEFVLEGRYFLQNDNMNFTINGAGISFDAKSGDTAITRSIATSNVPVDLSYGVPGGPYSITGRGSDEGQSVSYSASSDSNGAGLFTLYPAPSITSVSKKEHYQGEEAISFSVYGSGFYTDVDGNKSSYYQIIDSSGNVVQGVGTIIETVTGNEISGTISIDEGSGYGSGLGIKVINPDGKGGTSNSVSVLNLVDIDKKKIPHNMSTITLEPGFSGSLRLESDTSFDATNDVQYGFEKHSLPEVTVMGAEDKIRIDNVVYVSSGILLMKVSVDKDVEIGTYYLTVKNPTWKDAIGYWEVHINPSSKSKLGDATTSINLYREASSTTSDYSIEQGTTSLCYFKIEGTSGAIFDTTPKLTSDDSSIVFSDIVRLSDTLLSCIITTGSGTKIGEHNILVSNEEYSASKSVTLLVSTSPYNRLSDSGIEISSTGLYQNSGTISSDVHILPGESKFIEFEISDDTVYFEEDCEVTVINSKDIKVDQVIREQEKHKLLVKFTVSKDINVVGSHTVRFKNKTYGCIATANITVSNSDYFFPYITMDESDIDRGYKYKFYQGESKEIVVEGGNFSSSATFKSSSNDIEFSNIVIVNSREARMRVTISENINIDGGEIFLLTVTNNDWIGENGVSVNSNVANYFYIVAQHKLEGISPSSLAPGEEYNFYLNGSGFLPSSPFSILMDGKRVYNKEEDIESEGEDVSKYVIFMSSVCTSEVQIACRIKVGTGVASGYHDIGVNFEAIASTSTMLGVLNIPSPPVVTLVANTVSQGDTNKDVVIQGRNFDKDAQVVVSGSGITISSTIVTSENSITFRCDVEQGAEVTDREVKVLNGTGLSSTGTLRVVAAPKIESCSPASVITGTTRSIEIQGTSFGKYFRLSMSGHYFVDLSTCTVDERNEIIENDTTCQNIYLLSASYTGDTSITANLYFSSNVISGKYDILVVNYMDKERTSEAAKGNGAGVLTIRQPLTIMNEEETVPIGYIGKVITLKGTGFSQDTKVTMLDSGVELKTDQMQVINDKEINITIDVSKDANIGNKRLQVKDDITGSKYQKDFIRVINPVTISEVLPEVLALGVRVATVTIQGSYFDIDYDTGDILEFEGVRGARIRNNSVIISGDGIDNLCLDTTTYNSSYMQLYMSIVSTATLGVRSLTVINKDGENEANKETAFIVGEVVKVESMQPNAFKVGANSGDMPFVITGSNFDVEDSDDIDVVSKYLEFTNNTNLEFKRIRSHTDTEIQGEFNWKATSGYNTIGNRNVDIKVKNRDGSVGTAKNALTLSEPLGIESVNPVVIPIGAKDLMITVKGRGFLNNIDAKLYKDSLDESVTDEVKDNIVVKDIVVVSGNELTMKIDTNSSLPVIDSYGGIKLYLKNTGGDYIETSADVNDSLYIPFCTGNLPTLYSVEPSNVRVRGKVDNIELIGINLNSVVGINFSNGLKFVESSRTDDRIKGTLYAENAYTGSVTINLSTTNVLGDVSLPNRGKFVVNPSPNIDSINPSVFYKGISSVLSISGGNFDTDVVGNGVKVYIERQDKETLAAINVSTSNINTNSNRVVINNLKFLYEGKYNIRVTNPDDSYVLIENAIECKTANSAATVTSLNPSFAKLGATVDVYVEGTNFMEGMSIYSRGGGITISTYTIYTGSATFSMTVNNDANLGRNAIVFANPNSEAMDVAFYVVDTPKINEAVPKSLVQGTTNLITISGSNFLDVAREFSGDLEYINAKISGDGISYMKVEEDDETNTEYNGTTNIRVKVYVDEVATKGKRDILVTNPFSLQGVGASLIKVVEPIMISSVTPSIIAQSNSNKTVVIRGSGFEEGVSVDFTGYGVKVESTKFISENEIEVVVTVDNEAESGWRGAIITNPDAEGMMIENLLLIGTGIGVERIEPSKIGRGVELREIDIIGSDFGESTGTIKISGTGITLGEILYWSDKLVKIKVTVGKEASLGSRDVTVVTSDNNSGVGSGVLEIVDSVVIDKMVPESITQGTSVSVVIEGSGFTETGDIDLLISDGEGIDIRNVRVSGDTNLLFDVYVSTYTNVGAHDITVKTKNGYGVGKGKFVVDEFLSLTEVSPSKLSRGVVNREIYVYGTGFTEDSELSIEGGGVTINKVYYQNSKLLKAVVTLSLDAVLGDRQITVKNNNGTNVTMTGIFEVIKEVKIDSVTPMRLGVGMKEVEVKIKGAEFKEGAELSFSGNGIEIVRYTVDSSNLITAVLNVLDEANVGNYNVVVTNLDMNSGVRQGGIEVYEKVKIDSVVGMDDLADYFVIPDGGGEVIKKLKVKGSGFEEGENGEMPNVEFSLSGIIVEKVYFDSQNEITCDVKIDCSNIRAGNISDIKVRNVDGSVGSGTGVYFAMDKLELTKISPKRLSQGANNVSFNISGKGFVEDGLKVGFYSPHTDAIVVKNIDYQSSAFVELKLDILTEAEASIPVNFYIENKNGDIVYSSDVFRGEDALQINDAPVIKEVEPSSLQQGSRGQILKIIGTSFSPEGLKSMTIGNIKGVEIETYTFTNNEIEMTVNVKSNADIGGRNIEITTVRASKETGGSDVVTTGVGEGLFSITTLPVVTSVSSNVLFLDREYNDFTIYGDGFSEASTLEFSDKEIKVDKIKINSQKSMTMDLVISPEVSVGQIDITIDNHNGSVGTSKGIFEVMEQPIPPSFTSISMMYLPINQKNRVKVVGSNLQEGIIADFRDKGIVVSSLVWVNANGFEMDVEVSEDVVLGKYNLVLTNPDGGRYTCKNAIEVIGKSNIEMIDPSVILKDVNGDRVVNIVIRGTNFSDKINPSTIKVNENEVEVIEDSFKFISTKEISVDIVVTSSTIVGMKSVEFMDGNSSYYCRIKDGLEIKEEIEPKVLEILPEIVMRDKGEAELVVRGEDFREGIMVESRISGIKVTTVTYRSQNEILVGVSIVDTEVGGYSLFFKNPYGREVEVEDAVKVLAYPVIEKVEPSEILIDEDRVVHLVVTGKDFYEGMDASKILIRDGRNIKVDTTTFKYNGRTNISFDVLVSGDADEGDYDIEVDNLSGIKGIGKGLIKIVYDTSKFIRNVSISSGKVITDKGESSRVFFYFTLKETCKVELLVYLSTEPLVYSESHKVQEIDYLVADKYGKDNSKVYWDGRYPGTGRKINGSYNFIIRATSKETGEFTDYFVTKDTKKMSKLNVEKSSEVVGAGSVDLNVYYIDDMIEVVYNENSPNSANEDTNSNNNSGNKVVDASIYPYTVHFWLSKAFNVKITFIEKATGLVARTDNFGGIGGDNNFNWDGKGDDGEYVNKGAYEIMIECNDDSLSDDEKPEPKVSTMSGIGISKDMDINERRRYFEKNAYPYPNPVNMNKHNVVRFSYWMEKEGSVNCYIYNTIGQLVWKANRYSSEGKSKTDYIEWDLKGRSGKKIARGLYIMVMEAKEKGTGEMLKATKKMMVIK